MFTNKHVIIAMIVAPILSVLAWIGVGQIAGEQPQVANPGSSYPLVEKSNCRYESGACDLQNEEFKLRITLQQAATGPVFIVNSSHALEGMLMSVGLPGVEQQPAPLRASDGQGLAWRLAVDRVPAANERIHLVARASGSTYFAEASTTFLQPDESK